MIEVHIVSKENRTFYNSIMKDYFQQRYQIFVQEKGWADLTPRDGMEQDQFDDEEAVYVVATDEEGVIGGHRFHPTITPHLLDTVFPYLSSGPVPTGYDIWEATRYFVRRSRRAGLTDALMMVATYQFCLEEGVTQLTGILEMAALSRRIQAGLHLRPLGLPQEVGGESVVAVVADMTEEGFRDMLRRLRAKPLRMTRRDLQVGDIGDRVLVRRHA